MSVIVNVYRPSHKTILTAHAVYSRYKMLTSRRGRSAYLVTIKMLNKFCLRAIFTMELDTCTAPTKIMLILCAGKYTVFEKVTVRNTLHYL